jgi:hypothetical protein
MKNCCSRTEKQMHDTSVEIISLRPAFYSATEKERSEQKDAVIG